MHLKEQTRIEIDQIILSYPHKHSAILPVLHCVQAAQGYICKEAVEWIAKRLDLNPIDVYGLVTFYPSFRANPIGRCHIRVCRSLPCALRGAYKAYAELKKELTTDGKLKSGQVTIELVECLAGCGGAPTVLLNEELHEGVDEQKARELAASIRNYLQNKE
jgi:NADH-quinone oxidoreductase subunit E